MGVGPFADMTRDQFKKFLTPMNVSDITGGRLFIPRANVKAPDSMDWREKGAVTPVKYQGMCGSCYAFSATASLESHLFLKTKKLVPLSEQSLVDCTKSYSNRGCNGGNTFRCFRYVKDNGGIATEASYPYEAEEGECRYKPEHSGGTVKDFGSVGDEKSMLDFVGTVGPLSIMINGDAIQNYYGGIFSGDCPHKLNHFVNIVGYGTSPRGTDYWIIKNSWSGSWGENGYMRLIRNHNQCGIGPTGVYPIV